jgi:hypothetical protein
MKANGNGSQRSANGVSAGVMKSWQYSANVMVAINQ